MSGNLRLYNSGGYVELQAPSNATSQTLVLPTDSIQPGLVHIATESFTGVSSVSLDNVFSADYDFYRIIFHGSSSSSSSTGLLIRLRASGVDVTTTTYKYNYNLNGSSAIGSFVTNTRWQVGNVTSYATASMDITDPFLSSTTGFVCTTFTEGSNNYVGVHGGRESSSGSVDGFTLFPDGAYTITGTLRAYGYRNA